jgi:hypothetical protein
MKKYINWFLEGKFLYIYLVLLILAWKLDDFDIGIKTDGNIRLYGLFLQIIGSVSLIYSLRDKLILFKGWKLTDFFIDYFKRFPFNKMHNTSYLQGSINIHTTVNGNLRKDGKPKENFQDIIKYFNEEIEDLHKLLVDLKKDLKSDVKRIDGELSEHKAKICKELNETKMLISDSSVSNIWLDLFGIFSIITGLIFATISDIIEKIFFK